MVKIPGHDSDNCIDVESYRREAIKIADDFNYGKRVIKKIKNAETSNEISRIMKSARIKKFGLD